jgi:hypothetical protein
MKDIVDLPTSLVVDVQNRAFNKIDGGLPREADERRASVRDLAFAGLLAVLVAKNVIPIFPPTKHQRP